MYICTSSVNKSFISLGQQLQKIEASLLLEILIQIAPQILGCVSCKGSIAESPELTQV